MLMLYASLCENYFFLCLSFTRLAIFGRAKDMALGCLKHFNNNSKDKSMNEYGAVLDVKQFKKIYLFFHFLINMV